MSKLDVFHDATLRLLRFDPIEVRGGVNDRTNVVIELQLLDGRRAEVSCLDVVGMDISGVTTNEQLLELGVRTHAQHPPGAMGWALHMDAERAATDEHCARLVERVHRGELVEVLLAGAITLNGHVLCRGVEIRIDGARLQLTAEDTRW